MEFKCLADVTESSVKWLWPGLIPRGMLTVVEGPPGVNKSSFCCDVAARVTVGEVMPGATGKPCEGAALLLVGEDSPKSVVLPRLNAAGADVAKVHVSEDAKIPDDLEELEKKIKTEGIKVVIVDTLDDFFNGSTVNNQVVRRGLEKLRAVAERTQTAILIIRHVTKKASGRSLLRGLGAGAITAVAHAQIKVFKHPDDEHLRVLVQDKNKLSLLPPALLFEVCSTDDGHFNLEWRGETDLTIADLENTKGGGSKLAAAEKFLLEKLADGPKEVNWLVEQVKQDKDISKRTLDEAKKNLGIDTDRKGRRKDQIVSWVLPTVEEPKKRQAKAATRTKKPAGKKPASKTPAGKAPRAKQPARKKPATQKPANKAARSKAPKVYVPKTSKYEIE